LFAHATAAILVAAAPAILFAGAGPAQADDNASGLLDAANASRVNNGCPAWVTSPALQAAAQSHAADILKNGTKDGHTGTDNSTPGTRANANGWSGGSVGEIEINDKGANLPTPQDVIAAWGGDGHSLAFSDCKTTDVGVAFQGDGTNWVAIMTAGAR
jgi:uncharacterized protein YkwD